MILLVDNQLTVALARHLSASGCECIHLLDVGLDDGTIKLSGSTQKSATWSS